MNNNTIKLNNYYNNKNVNFNYYFILLLFLKNFIPIKITINIFIRNKI